MAAVWINTMESKSPDSNSEANSLLFVYAREGNIDKVREILAKGSPLGTDTVGTTALHCAVAGNQLETVELLLRAGIQVDYKTKVDRTPLHLAAYYGHAEIVRKLLEKNCKVDPHDFLHMTPLHWAVEKRFPDIVKMLLSRGADPTAISKFLKTPRTIAMSKGYGEILQLLDYFEEGEENGTVSLLTEAKEEQQDTVPSNMVDYEMKVLGEDGEEEQEGEDIPAGDTMSIFEVDDDEEEEDDGVEVIPAADSVEISLEQDSRGAVPPDSDESLSNLHETINKLGNIRGLKPTDANTLRILQNIGIQMSTEEPDPTIISNALQSGRKIILSEAGKFILNQTKSSDKFPVFGQQQQVPMASSTPLNNNSNRAVSKPRKPPPPPSPSSLVRPNSGSTAMASVPFSSRMDESGNLVLRRKRTRGGQQDLLNELEKVQRLDTDSSEMCEMELFVDAAGEDGEQAVPLNRIQKMEKQILVLSRENKQLKNKLELSIRLIEDNMKRLERLEAGVDH